MVLLIIKKAEWQRSFEFLRNMKSYQFCLDLLHLVHSPVEGEEFDIIPNTAVLSGRQGNKPLVNVLLGLCTSPEASSVTEITDSPFYQYHYSMVTKVLERWQYSHLDIRRFVLNYIDKPQTLSNGLSRYSFIHDFTKLEKNHSETNEDRVYLKENATAPGLGKSTMAGYQVGTLHYNTGESNHCPMLAQKRVKLENHLEVAQEQIEELMKSNRFIADLLIFLTDAYYGRAQFLFLAYLYDNMLIITRLQTAINVYVPSDEPKKFYGQAYSIIPQSKDVATFDPRTRNVGVKHRISINELTPNEENAQDGTLENGRKVTFYYKRWNGLLFRSKRGKRMHDKPFDVISIIVEDAETKELVFDRCMWLAVAGKQKAHITTEDVHEQYIERSNVEGGGYRFSKQNLLMDKLQTPDVKHLDRWLDIVMLSTWYIYMVAGEAKILNCTNWQKYTARNKAWIEAIDKPRMTPAQAHRSAQSVICLYDLKPFKPNQAKPGKGRQKGVSLDPRPKHPIMKKEALVEKYKNKAMEKAPLEEVKLTDTG
jgi:hypothetical protein